MFPRNRFHYNDILKGGNPMCISSGVTDLSVESKTVKKGK
jgi:hypothetical protein